jgi:hypothetical protein
VLSAAESLGMPIAISGLRQRPPKREWPALRHEDTSAANVWPDDRMAGFYGGSYGQASRIGKISQIFARQSDHLVV